MFIKSFPDEIELMGFFESEPIAASEIDDLHFIYKISDDNEMELTFSFCATAGWLQAVTSFNGKEVSRYLSEHIGEIKILKDNLGEYLCSEVVTDELITKIMIRVRPYISVNSSSLVR